LEPAERLVVRFLAELSHKGKSHAKLLSSRGLIDKPRPKASTAQGVRQWVGQEARLYVSFSARGFTGWLESREARQLHLFLSGSSALTQDQPDECERTSSINRPPSLDTSQKYPPRGNEQGGDVAPVGDLSRPQPSKRARR
jgi:hypothetical protein